MASREVDTLISLQKPNVRKLVRGTSVTFFVYVYTLSVLVHAILTVQTELKSAVLICSENHCVSGCSG